MDLGLLDALLVRFGGGLQVGGLLLGGLEWWLAEAVQPVVDLDFGGFESDVRLSEEFGLFGLEDHVVFWWRLRWWALGEDSVLFGGYIGAAWAKL